MQSKVSMFMPCYNKQDYIGVMLESIMNQTWDNIELILVNDGSTDNTRAVISEWEPRLRARGFEVVIIDQKNAGVITAAKTGLERITGDYICQVDADDELDPMYVSTMAGWLDEHPEHNFTVCDYITYSWIGDKKLFRPFLPALMNEIPCHTTEHFLVNQLFGTVWLYMLRTDYFNKCRVLDNYKTGNRWSHEPGYILPIHAMGGSFKYFPLPLYRFFVGGDGLSQYKSFEYFERYTSEHISLCKRAILALPESAVSPTLRDKLVNIADFALIKHLFSQLNNYPDGPAQRERIIKMLLDYTGTHFGKTYTSEQIAEKESELIQVIADIHTNKEIPRSEFPGRVIAYGAKGVKSARIIPQLRGTLIEPSELWDAGADGSLELFGIPLKKPDLESLTETDTVLILPGKRSVVTEIYGLVKHKNLHRILFYDDVYEFILHNVTFPLQLTVGTEKTLSST